jgi:translation initiation factor 3 subunit M
VEAIATALRLPSIFDFDSLFKLDAVLNVKNHELFSLLQVFLSGGLPEFKAWQSNHPQVLEIYREFIQLTHFYACPHEVEITSSELERKIRLLTLASLAFKHIGQNLSYSKVAEALQVDPSEVEKWVIDGTKFYYFYRALPLTCNRRSSHPGGSCLGKTFTNHTKPSYIPFYLSFI